ncbi:hypothetical protein ACHQM5_009672 [Ranunculus cassubicifolius]
MAAGDSYLEKATKQTDELYNLRDTYFSSDPQEKTSRLQIQADLALNLLDSIPIDEKKSPLQRANIEFLKGKIHDVFPEFRQKAEDHLVKAVKLNPSFADAWLYLGNCIWKKGDLVHAKNYYNLGLEKGPNKKILCQLSMLERRMAQGTENQMQLIEDSIRHAKEAILLDVEDGNSWYNLGNAYLTSFFATGSRHHKKLLESLKAYQHAEKDEAMQSNPDLYFNSATVNKYLENYERALTGFQAAALKDPGLNATEEVQKMVTLLDNLANCSKVKGKRAVSLTSSLSDMNLNTSLKKATVKQLSEGLNKDVVVLAKVLQYIKYNDVAPLYYLMCDLEQSYFILSVYGVRPDVIKEGDQLTIVVPYFRDVNFSWNSKKYEFKSIRVDFSEQITVNGKTLGKDHAVPTSVSVEHKP